MPFDTVLDMSLTAFDFISFGLYAFLSSVLVYILFIAPPEPIKLEYVNKLRSTYSFHKG